MAQMDEYFFCSAKSRPSYCKVETNTCCLNCEHNAACQVLAEGQHGTQKLLPCTRKHVGDEETCQFAI